MTEFINDELAEIESEPEVYMLIQDDDSHWYVIEADQKEDFLSWVYATNAEEECDYDFDDCRVNGSPSRIRFSSYWIE